MATPEVAAPQAATPAREIANAWPTAAAPRPAPQVEPAPAPAAGASEPQPTQPAMPVRELDPGAIRLLMQQGEQFMSTGDVVSARVVFQRAAEARDPSAALAMGATYDPLLLSKIGAVGVSADVEKARFWYEKAKEFGSQEAPRRLELLAKR